MNPTKRIITEDERVSTYRTSEEAIRELYASEDVSNAIFELQKKVNLGEKSKLVSTIVGDVILGFYKISDLPRLLSAETGMTKEDAQKLVSNIIDFLSPIVEREAAEARAKKDEVTSLADKIAAIQATPETTAEHEPVKPIRTMTADMNRVHGYGALPPTESTEDEPAVKATSQYDIRPTNQ